MGSNLSPWKSFLSSSFLFCFSGAVATITADVDKFFMRAVFHREHRGTFRRGTQPKGAAARCLSAVLATIVGAATILSLAGCRSQEYPPSARGPAYSGVPSPYAERGPYDSPRPQPHYARGPHYPAGVQGRAGASRSVRSGPSYWDGDRFSGSPSIRIDLRTQRAYFYKGQQLAGVSQVSTGRPGYDTPAGSFRITQKSPNHRSNLYGDYVDAQGRVVKANVDARRDVAPPGTKFRGASMPYFLRFNGAIGMHAGHLPGYPASSGCVRLPEQMARHFFANAPTGTPVTVVR